MYIFMSKCLGRKPKHFDPCKSKLNTIFFGISQPFDFVLFFTDKTLLFHFTWKLLSTFLNINMA